MQDFVGRADDAHIHRDAFVVADAPDFAFLENAQKFCLQRRRHRVDFIEENCPEVRFLEKSALVGYGPGERALLVPEQFRLEQILRQRAAIDGDERMMLAVAVEVQPTRDQLLAGAAFALDQHGAVGVGDLVDEVVNELHFSARADDVFEAIPVLEFLAEVNVLAQRRLVIERALHRHLQLVDLKRLRHVIIRAHLHRLDRGLHRGVGRDQNDGGLPVMLADVTQDIEARHRFHFNVGDHNLRADRIELLDGFRRGVERENLMAFFAAERHDDLHHGRFIVDNDDLCHSRSAENISHLRKGKLN